MRIFPSRRQGAPRRILLLLLSVCLLALAMLAPLRTAAAEDALPAPELSAQAALLMDADSGLVICSRNAHRRLPMASTTKIMTALCVVEQLEPQEMICIDARAVGVEGSSIYLYAGEWLTVRQLLMGLLLESANDAAVALSIAVSGSVEAFADVMNRKAAALGLQDTHFVNPHGLDDEQHYTTAHDLALIAKAALAHPVLREIMSTTRATIPLCDMIGPQRDDLDPLSASESVPDEGTRVLLNHNKLLRQYSGAIGVKTGYTKRSGRCLVSAAQRDGLTLIAVTLNAPDDWNDHATLLDYGFSHYARLPLCQPDDYRTLLPVSGGVEDYVMVSCAEAVAVTLPAEHGAIHCRVELPHFLLATVPKQHTVGRLVFLCDTDGDGVDEQIATASLVTLYEVKRSPPPSLPQRILALLRRLFGMDGE